jgi:glycosyltransferase involved in cell wall biosynthesis
MTTFNHQKYIQFSVNSVLAQSYNDLELIIVDDNSNYNLFSVIEQNNLSQVRIINAGGVGVGAAINIGLSEAKGEFIALFSGDDIAHPNRIETQLNIVNNRPNVLSFSLPNIIDENGRKQMDNICPFYQGFYKNFSRSKMINNFFLRL